MTSDADRWPTFRIAIPDGWHSRGDAASGSMRAVPADAAATDPTHVLVITTVDPAAIGDLDAYAVAQLRGSVEMLTDALPIAVRTSDGPDGGIVDLTVAHDAFGLDVTSVQRHVVGPAGTVVIASATTEDLRWPDRAGELIATVRSVSVSW